MHSNVRTERCLYCGEAIAPNEGVARRIDGVQCFLHAGCDHDAIRHADYLACDDAFDFMGNSSYTYGED